MPYLNNYDIYGFDPTQQHQREWMVILLENYKKGAKYPIGWNQDFVHHCPHEACGAVFNFYSQIERGVTISCPTCLRPVLFPEGRLL